MRYWPARVDAKCRNDPSLAVAHARFWRYHPERAWKWELRLQDEIGPAFRIDEPDAAACRAAWLASHPDEALSLVEAEAHRRRKKTDDAQVIADLTLPDPGLWRDHPARVWAMEMRVIEKQSPRKSAGAARRPGHDFRLRTPDEPAARAAFEAANPRLAEERRQWVGAADLFAGPAR